MPISTATVAMRDPSLRRPPLPLKNETKEEARANYGKYMKSSVVLPRIWARITQLSPHHPGITSRKLVKEYRQTEPYFPFCKSVYKFAVGESVCFWRHIVLHGNTHLTYNFPCGCHDPHIEYMYLNSVFPSHYKTTSAALLNPPSPHRSTDTCYEVPFCPAFRESANPSKRKKRGLSLTDSKTYRRRVRSRYSPSVCSSSLRTLAGGESDQEDTTSP